MELLPILLGCATLLPLVSFFIILVSGRWMSQPRQGALIATGAIVGAAVLSFISMGIWLTHHYPVDGGGHGEHGHASVAAPDVVRGQSPVHEATGSDADGSSAGGSPHGDGAHERAAGDEEPHADGFGDPGPRGGHHAAVPPSITGNYYLLGRFGDMQLTISYFIDSLTICMFCMVTLIASCIHFYAMGYMHDEEHEITDHEVTLSDGSPLKRPGRFPRFFQYLSLFCFSMLGLVVAGNIAMVFVFWELVGICSYFLIGFYVERKSASTAANKAFIVNRVGDFGMIIGLMALWGGLGTFAFGDVDANDDGHIAQSEQGIFSQVRPADDHHHLVVPTGLVRLGASDEVDEIVAGLPLSFSQQQCRAVVDPHLAGWQHGHELNRGSDEYADWTEAVIADLALQPMSADPEQLAEVVAHHELPWLESHDEESHTATYGYGLLIIAGVGIFCGCVGKSAQFPLHTWLPDAMEGPTPVSALVHSATMVAAGVYLVGRFFPVFTPEVLAVIATTGVITLFMAATIAITATDIKRVLAYSTVSQLGYMMLALGVGGWLAGLLHLITHAFFKSLLFMCSGSVIHAVHTNEMTEMGGLRKKMPITAYTMLVGCLAIAGISIPFVVGFSGYYSKDMILEQAFSFMGRNTGTLLGGLYFAAAAGGAAITAFYMFRLWYLTFAGKPRDQHRYDHAHESPKVMYMPLIILAVFATGVVWKPVEAMIVVVLLLIVAAALMVRRAIAGADRQQGRGLMLATTGAAAALAVIAFLMAAVDGAKLDKQTATLNFSPHESILIRLLEQARPAGTAADATSGMFGMTWPDEHFAHQPEQYGTIVVPVTLLATATALCGIALATVMYVFGYLDPRDVSKQFRPVHRFLVNKWWFDELFDWLFVRPTHVISRFISGIDRRWIDGFLDGLARMTRGFANAWDFIADRTVVDGLVNLVANWIYSVGLALRAVQTGKLRQYVMFIVLGAIAIFVLISYVWVPTFTG